MSLPSYTIRDARPEDTEAIIKMHAESWLETYPNDEASVAYEWVKDRIDKWLSEEKLTRRRKRIEDALHNPNSLYKVAVTEMGEIVGIAFPIRDENEQRVGGLYVSKNYQGTGLAQQLMDEIVKWADPSRPLELEVATYNERAKAFYRKYGFEEIPGSEYYDVIPVVKMIRKGDEQ